jgi:hypothetical protein
MIDPTRRELLKLIEELSAACPEYRFGQLVLNLAFMAREDGDRLAWHVEDAEFVEAARKHLADWYASHDKADDPARPNKEDSRVNPLQKLLEFLSDLDGRKIFHRLSQIRPEAIMVEIAVPGERWEVEFFADGHVEVEVFGRSPGIVGGEEALQRLFDEFSD